MMERNETIRKAREALDERGIAYELGKRGELEHLTIWNHNGHWVSYDVYDRESGGTCGTVTITTSFTKDKRDVDADVFARILEALS